MPMLIPLGSITSRRLAVLTGAGLLGRRRAAPRRPAPPSDALPRPRRITAPRRSSSPRCATAGLRGGLLAWDGQLEDDARLVTTVARTAASYGAHVRTRARVLAATGTSVELRDELHRRDARPSPPARSSTPPASGPATSSPR